MIWSIAVLAWAEVEAHRFAPALDRPYRYVTEDVRPVLGRPRRFVAERRILFRREGEGLVAEVTLDRLVTDAPGEIGRRFLAAAGGLKGRTVRFRLASDGAVLAVEDQAATWAAMVAGFRAVNVRPPSPDPRGEASRDPAATMAALPPERQRAAIVSIVAGLFCDPSTLPAAGRRAVQVPGRTLPGAPVLLAGEEVVEPVSSGQLRIVIRAGGAGIGIVRTRVLDPATGLLMTDEDVTALGGQMPQTLHTTRRSLVPVSPYPSAKPRKP